ncbi:MAG TPA: PKD domain-containing protein, partial [Saprospiraceae bacterium]|nr:PKD domain-containing protein [Saprospiraceae bacterium]
MIVIPFKIESQSISNIAYEYDNIGRLRYVTYDAGTVVEYCYDELGNRICEIITSDVIAQPDIIIADLDVSAADLCQSATFEITIIQDNLGNLATGSYVNEVRLSADTIYNDTDDLLLVQYLQSIDPAGSIEINETVELPEDLPAGEYYILVKADPQNTVNELSEENNIEFLGITVSESNGVSIVISIQPDTCDQGTGSAIVLVLEGSAPYTYEWSTFPAQPEGTATDLTEGTYSVTVTDAMGCQEIETVTIPNIGTQPAPSFTYSVDGLEVSFQNTTPNGESYAWDFGDGLGSADTNVVHTYDIVGVYTICLSASNQCGGSTHCIGISLGNMCDSPTELYIVRTTGTTISLIWNEVITATEYSIKFREVGEVWEPELITSETEITVANLFPETLYELQVASLCGSNASSPLSKFIRTSTDYPPLYDEFISVYREVEGGCNHLEIVSCDVVGSRIISAAKCGFGVNYYDIALMATDMHGNFLWAKKLHFDEPVDIIELHGMDSSSVLVGFIYDVNSLRIIKADIEGNVSWIKSVSEPIQFYTLGRGAGFEVTSNGDIIVAYRQSFEGEDYYNLIKYDSSGTKQWAKRIRESGETYTMAINDITADNAGHIYVSGQTGNTGGGQWYFAKHNVNGALMWTKQIRPSSSGDNDYILEVVQDSFYFYGISNQSDNNMLTKMYITKFDSLGVPIWNRSYNGIEATGISFYGDSIAVSGNSGGSGVLMWFDKNGNALDIPAKYALPSTFRELQNPIHNKLLVCGRIDSTINFFRPSTFMINILESGFDFLCNDSYIGNDPNSPGWTVIAETFQIFDISGASDLVTSGGTESIILRDRRTLC